MRLYKKTVIILFFTMLLFCTVACRQEVNNDIVITPEVDDTLDNLSVTPFSTQIEAVTPLPTLVASITPTTTLSPTLTATPSPKPSPTPLVFLEKTDVVYETLSFTDSIELNQTEGYGWLIDLDGDGFKDKLYAAPDGIYINELRVLLNQTDTGIIAQSSDYVFWLLDIDTEDDSFELMTYTFPSYNLYYYTSKQGLITITHDACGFFNYDASFEDVVDIRRPIRIDPHTIAFSDRHDVFDAYFLTAAYRFDENHNLVVVQQEYEIIDKHPIAYINTEKKLRLYAERNLSGAYIEVDGPQVYMLTKSDAVSWIYLENVFGISGWIYYDRDGDVDMRINQMHPKTDFIGYNNVS